MRYAPLMENATRPLLARLNWYWILQVLGWTFVTLFVVLANAPYLDKPGTLVLCVYEGAAGLLLTDIWHRFVKSRRWNARRADWRTVWIGVALLGPAQLVNTGVASYVFVHKADSFKWVPMLLLFWGGIMLAWNVCYMTAITLRRANRFESEALRLDVLAKEAELRALQSQVNPHFFFNSLNSVRALIFESPESAAQMIDQLATLMRYTLQASYAETVPLKMELEAVLSYLAIEKIRFEERLSVTLDIEAGMEDVTIPPMSLQTLVENAVKYGVELSSTGSEIRISARRESGCARIEVANLGAILPFANSTRVGLTNARKRLALAKGESASLDLTENSGWVRATLQFPVAA